MINFMMIQEELHMCRQKSASIIGLLLISFFITLFSAAGVAQPGMMRHMDDEDYENMMRDRGGYGSGYGYGGYGYGRHMGPMGNMMGPMMGGGMMGPMMGGLMGSLAGLDLTDQQRDKVRDIFRDMRQQQWDLMEKMMETSDKLYDLYDADKPDPEKVGKVYDDIYQIKRKMIQQHLKTRNKIYDVLNKEQREQFKANSPFAHRFGMMMP
jgi:Spy/CpxP family protein refolding chaperone